jgi:hypothetical protein
MAGGTGNEESKMACPMGARLLVLGPNPPPSVHISNSIISTNRQGPIPVYHCTLFWMDASEHSGTMLFVETKKLERVELKGNRDTVHCPGWINFLVKFEFSQS